VRDGEPERPRAFERARIHRCRRWRRTGEPRRRTAATAARRRGEEGSFDLRFVSIEPKSSSLRHVSRDVRGVECASVIVNAIVVVVVRALRRVGWDQGHRRASVDVWRRRVNDINIVVLNANAERFTRRAPR